MSGPVELHNPPEMYVSFLKKQREQIQQELRELEEASVIGKTLSSFIKEVDPPDGSSGPDTYTTNIVEDVLRAKSAVTESLKGAWSSVETALQNWARFAPEIPDLPGFYIKDLVGFNRITLAPSTFWKLESFPLKLIGFQGKVVAWEDNFGARYYSDHSFVTKALGLGCITHVPESGSQVLILQPGLFYTVGGKHRIDFPPQLVRFGPAAAVSEEKPRRVRVAAASKPENGEL